MRKIVGGLVLLTAIGLLTFILRSREESIEELKARYGAACFGREEHPRWAWILRQIVTEHDFWERRYAQRIERNEKALIGRSYLQERIFVLSNYPPREILDKAQRAFSSVDVAMLVSSNGFLLVPTKGARTSEDVIARTRIEGTNRFIVVAPQERMSAWELFIKIAEAPK